MGKKKANAALLDQPKKFPWPIVLGAAVIIVATVLVYLPAIQAGYIWDDPDYVTNNSTLRDFSGLVQIWTNPWSIPQWYPLVHTTFWIEYHLWDLNPLGYHLDNVILHIISSLLLWRILRKLDVPGAWLAGAIFALHPIQVESVAWITERKNVLSGVFLFLSLLSYLRFLDDPKRRGFYIASLGCFLAALFSKTVVAPLPAAILVILWWKKGSIGWKDIKPLIPFFVLGIGLGIFTAYLEKTNVGATGEHIVELRLPAVNRVLIAGRVIAFYAAKFFWPWPQMFIYQRWEIDPHVVWQWAFPIGVILVICAAALSRKRLGRGPAAAIMIYCGMLFPVLGFLNVYPMRFSFVADHFQYHAAAALIALTAAILWKYGKKFSTVVLVPLAILTMLRTPVFSDAETLWRDNLVKNDHSWMVYTNLAKVMVMRGEKTGNPADYDEAEQLYRQALELVPSIHETHANMGMMYGYRGDDADALREFNETLKINPNFAPAYYGIGQIYLREHKLDQAIDAYEHAVQIAPSYPEANYRLAVALQQKGDLNGAVERYRKAVAGMPENRDLRFDIGGALIGLGRFDEAAYNLRQAVHIDPNYAEAWLRLGFAQQKLGQMDEAANSFRTALQLKPELAKQVLGH